MDLEISKNNKALELQIYTNENKLFDLLNSVMLLSDKEFISYPKLKIKDVEIEIVQIQLPYVITQAAMLCAFKGEISDAEAQDISIMILSRFKSLSILDIAKAFQNERYGVYDDATKHYQVFNADYVKDILSKYKYWRGKKRKSLNLMPVEIKNELTVPIKTLDEIADEIKSFWDDNKKMPLLWYRKKHWLATWKKFHNMPELMGKYRKKAETMVKLECQTVSKYKKKNPKELDVLRTMAELSLIDIWSI